MKILGKNILVSPVDISEFKVGAIFIPQSASNVPHMKDQEGVVAAIGSAIKESLEYKKGSHVFIEIYRAKEVELEGVKYLMVPQDAVVGLAVEHSSGRAFHPIGNKILLRQIKTVDRASKIIRPGAYENDKEGVVECVVQALGSGNRAKDGGVTPFAVSLGQSVLVQPFAGRDVDTPEGSYKLVEEQHIEAVLTND